ADQGALVVDAPVGAEVTVARYEPYGLLLRYSASRLVADDACLLDSGSYLVTARYEGREVRYPLLIERAKAHHLRLRFPESGEVPPGMTLLPGAPSLASPPRAKRAARAELPDFMIGCFPVTFREYIEFLESIADPQERERRTPGHGREGDPLIVRDGSGGW